MFMLGGTIWLMAVITILNNETNFGSYSEPILRAATPARHFRVRL